MSMFFRGGVMNYGPKQAGIENLALSAAASCGTKNYSVDDYQELADEYGISIAGASTTDYGIIGMNCISKYFEQGWKLFSDAVVNPAFDKAEFQNTKDRMISGISQRRSDPEERIEQMSMETMFKGSQYSVDPIGYEATVGGFTADSVRNYYHNQLLNVNRMFLVVAGNITKAELEKKILAAFKSIPSKPYTAPDYTVKPIEGESVYFENRDIATNYMSSIMNAPVFSSPDYHPFMLVINALSGNLNYQVRVKQGLSYAPGATIKTQQMPYMSMYVSTTQPKKAFQAMVGVFNSISEGRYSKEFLEGIKKDHRSRFYRHQESSSSIVKDLGEAEILGGYKLEEDMITNIDKVTLESMKAAFDKYIKGAIWLYLGDEMLGKEAFK